MPKRVLWLCLILLLSACGKRGALIYPELAAPAVPASVTAMQSGSDVRLSFRVPRKDMAGRALSQSVGVRIYKRGVAAGGVPACTVCTTADFVLFRTLYENVKDPALQSFDDLMVLLDSDVSRGGEYSYSVVPFLPDGTAGEASAPVSVAVAEAISPPFLQAESLPTEVKLNFSSQGAITPLGFNVYRAIKGEAFPFLPRNGTLVREASYTDIGLQRNLSYVYMVRGVYRLTGGVLVESQASNVVAARLSEE